MKYVLLYFAAGVVVLVITVLQDRRTKKRDGPSLSDSLTELKLQNAPAWKRFMHKVVVPVLAGILVILVWPVAIVMVIKGALDNKARREAAAKREFAVSEQDLLEKLTLEEIEEREVISDPLGAVPDKPFGHLWPAWQKFRDEIQPGDELWSFAATHEIDPESVEQRCGYVISRKSKLGPYFLVTTKAAQSQKSRELSRAASSPGESSA